MANEYVATARLEPKWIRTCCSLIIYIYIYYLLFFLFLLHNYLDCVTHWTRLCSVAMHICTSRLRPLPAVPGTLLCWSEQANAVSTHFQQCNSLLCWHHVFLRRTATVHGIGIPHNTVFHFARIHQKFKALDYVQFFFWGGLQL